MFMFQNIWFFGSYVTLYMQIIYKDYLISALDNKKILHN